MKIIGYDFDGVFINIENEKAKLFGDILHKHWGVDPSQAFDVWLLHLGTSRRHKFDLMYQNNFQNKLEEETYQAIEKEFSDILVHDYYPNVKIIDETFETARDLNYQFDLSFISSGIPHAELNSIASKFKIDEYFDLILGTSQNFKSKIDHFDMIAQKHCPSLGIFIGDGLEDMKIAKQFKYTAIGIPANHTSQVLVEAGADIICDFPFLKQEIKNLLWSSQ
jgi:phosphoglycolate phosphatase-like HAD superfamily hydrolase